LQLGHSGATQLNGWKEIASYLGKGVRTVQRWEIEYGLPVRRAGRDGQGETVFALVEEVDRWRAAQPKRHELGLPLGGTPHEAPIGTGTARSAEAETAAVSNGLDLRRARWPRLRSTSLIILVLALATTGWLLRAARRTTDPPSYGREPRLPQPSSWRVEGESLVVYDSSGRPLWHREFPGLQAAAYLAVPRLVSITDLDGDGRREVLFVAATELRSERLLYCLEHDGGLRFVHRPHERARFGVIEFGPPWLAYHVYALAAPTGRTSVWATFIHSLWFPSVLQELDQRGKVAQEYWSDGYISSVAEGMLEGRHVVLVGAGNNEHRGASLSILARDRVRGAAPSVDRRYACTTGTAPGSEAVLAFFVFPGTCISRALDGQTTVSEAWVEAGGRIIARANVSVPGAGGSAPPDLAEALYTLSPGLGSARAEFASGYAAIHARLEQDGRLDHVFDRESHERALLPVLRWDGVRFVPLANGSVAH
jgi:hypothetical protein